MAAKKTTKTTKSKKEEAPKPVDVTKLPPIPKPKSRLAQPRGRRVTVGNRRGGERIRGGGRSLIETTSALMQSPVFRAVAAAMATKSGRGRAPHYPPVVVLLYGVLSRVVRGSATLDAELRNGTTWDQIRDLAAEHLGLELRDDPIQYEHFFRYRNRYLPEATIERLVSEFRTASVELATALGCFQPHGEDHEWLKPQLGNCLYGDGTILAPWSEVTLGLAYDHETGETATVPVGTGAKDYRNARIAEGIGANKKGFGPTTGRLYVGIKAMSPEHRCGVMLDIRAARDHSEMAAAQPALLELIDLLPGAVDAVIWDGGAQANAHRILLTHGVPLLNMPRRQSKKGRPRGNRKLQRHNSDPQVVLLDPLPHHEAATLHNHEFVVEDGGAIFEAHRQLDGSIDIGDRLPATELERCEQADGTFTWLLHHDVACEHGTVRLSVNPLGRGRSLTKSRKRRQLEEVMRVIPDLDELFAALYGVRNDVEAAWAWHKSTLRDSRSHSLHPPAEYFELLCGAILANTKAWYEYVHLPKAEAAA